MNFPKKLFLLLKKGGIGHMPPTVCLLFAYVTHTGKVVTHKSADMWTMENGLILLSELTR